MTELTGLEWAVVVVEEVVVTWEWEATKEWECLDMAWAEEVAMLKVRNKNVWIWHGPRKSQC
jgi:hypothetical protein